MLLCPNAKVSNRGAIRKKNQGIDFNYKDFFGNLKSPKSHDFLKIFGPFFKKYILTYIHV